ncbi:MAG: histidine--tRNA ligase [Clostridia bacterium]|nr:histidine--tRNA ligase [Clostridia bacterium]
MALITNGPRGTGDVLPSESYKWQYIEQTLMEVASLYGFKEIRIPVFEHTELFTRSVGDTTDVVQKEMYTFFDKGERSITLRPEGTAGTARALLQHGVLNDALPAKVSYLVSCYRYEKPQAGRLREFHQFGVECFGAESFLADAEVISLADSAFKTLGIRNLELKINSIGCPECRKRYHDALKAYFDEFKGELCGTCLDRLDRNPMRILDCKSPVCKGIAERSPIILDYLCDDCKQHFEGLKTALTSRGIEFSIDPRIVRGLDYYTRTVFEFVTTEIGAQGTVCGGGRYDGLTEDMGDKRYPGLGFGLGLERLLLLMEAQGCEFPEPNRPALYIASMGDAAKIKAADICERLRIEGFYALSDIMNRSVKAQMKYADKIGAKCTVVIGDSELESGEAVLKNMATGEQKTVKIENICNEIYDMQINEALEELELSADLMK